MQIWGCDHCSAVGHTVRASGAPLHLCTTGEAAEYVLREGELVPVDPEAFPEAVTLIKAAE